MLEWIYVFVSIFFLHINLVWANVALLRWAIMINIIKNANGRQWWCCTHSQSEASIKSCMLDALVGIESADYIFQHGKLSHMNETKCERLGRYENWINYKNMHSKKIRIPFDCNIVNRRVWFYHQTMDWLCDEHDYPCSLNQNELTNVYITIIIIVVWWKPFLCSSQPSILIVSVYSIKCER